MAKLFQTAKQTNLDNLRLNSTHNPENNLIIYKIIDEVSEKTTFRFEQNLKPLKNSRSVKTDAS